LLTGVALAVACLTSLLCFPLGAGAGWSSTLLVLAVLGCVVSALPMSLGLASLLPEEEGPDQEEGPSLPPGLEAAARERFTPSAGPEPKAEPEGVQKPGEVQGPGR
jgi:hypothetical protein